MKANISNLTFIKLVIYISFVFTILILKLKLISYNLNKPKLVAD
jgi:hypothetical protein